MTTVFTKRGNRIITTGGLTAHTMPLHQSQASNEDGSTGTTEGANSGSDRPAISKSKTLTEGGGVFPNIK